MRICRFARLEGGPPRIGLWRSPGLIADLSASGLSRLDVLLESPAKLAELPAIAASAPDVPAGQCRLLAPTEEQEVWAAGLTYPLARTARMLESPQSAVVHNLIYEAERPKIFFKSVAEKIVGPGEPVGVRSDSKWSVPEPELALVLDPQGRIAGYTVANDMTSRDLEGENLLYSPQAKIYHRSCSIGPWVRLNASADEIRAQHISISVRRQGVETYSKSVNLGDIHRSYEDLVSFLFRCQRFPRGVVLLTGTGIVAPESVNLVPGDLVEIEISGIGTLLNPVVAV